MQASLKDTETLFNALEWRLATLRAQQSRAAVSASVAAESASLPSACSPSSDHGGLEANNASSISPKRRSTDPDEEPEEAKKKRSE